MKLIVFGANGRTGRQLVIQGLVRGYEVTAFVRSDKGVLPKHKKLKIITGDARDAQAVAEAIRGHDAVVTAIAPKWLDKAHYDISEVATANIVSGMKANKVKRLIAQSGAWATDQLEDAHPVARLLFKPMLGKLYSYKAKEDAIIKDSGLEWTIVRCALLTPFGLRPKVSVDMQRHKTRLWELPMISRKSVAHFTLSAITDKKYFKKCPIIMN